MTEYMIVGENGERLAGGLASMTHALQIAMLYREAIKIYRIEPVVVAQKDLETGLWCAPDEWPNEETEA